MTHEPRPQAPPHPDSRARPGPGAPLERPWDRAPTTALIEVLRATGTPVLDPERAGRLPVAVRVVRAGAPLFVEGSKASAVHWVRSGTFRTLMTDEDGYEQVLGFSGPGDALGLDALNDVPHPTAAFALEDACVWAVPLCDFGADSPIAPELGELWRRAAARELMHRAELVHIMAAVAAEVRLARFLLMWSQRRIDQGGSSRVFRLAMGRRDLASLLGVAHETVSRTFSLLTALGHVRVSNRDVELLDPEGLRTFALSTRRPCDLQPARAKARRAPHAPPRASMPFAAH